MADIGPFVQCPLCAEHGALSHIGAAELSNAIAIYLEQQQDVIAPEAQAELLNLRNGLLGTLEREAPAIDELLL